MALKNSFALSSWRVEKIAVVGAGIVGVPMAALLARAGIRLGTEKPARVIVIQRNSATSGWKVPAINAGRSPIGGIEPGLDKIIAEAVALDLLRASYDYSELRDADVILVCVQTDKNGFRPDYAPLDEALVHIARELKQRPEGKIPLIIFESTLAPSSMATHLKEYFAGQQLIDGDDVLLGNSPNRVMPGHLVERIVSSDKIIGGLNPQTPKAIQRIYARFVTRGNLHLTNSLTAEIVKTLENAYRDVRIAYSAEIARYCDDHDIDFYQVREKVNQRLSWNDSASSDSGAVPSGGLLIPTIGVGGHCLPKDGILLLWRQIESEENLSASLILEARRVNDESPAQTIRFMEKHFAELSKKRIVLMGAAYRFNSEDTRNSPTFSLARQLLDRGCRLVIHDPYVKPDDQNLLKFQLEDHFKRSLEEALSSAEILIFCVSHSVYGAEMKKMIDLAPRLQGIFDGCNLVKLSDYPDGKPVLFGIGKGRSRPGQEFINFVGKGFQAVERGFANEIRSFVNFINERYADDEFNRVKFEELKRLAETCVTGCRLAKPGRIDPLPAYGMFIPRLVQCALKSSR